MSAPAQTVMGYPRCICGCPIIPGYSHKEPNVFHGGPETMCPGIGRTDLCEAAHMPTTVAFDGYGWDADGRRLREPYPKAAWEGASR